jgi:hypothetical protein
MQRRLRITKHYRNMVLFLFTGQLLERANTKGINPNIEGDLEYFVFLRWMWTGMGSTSCLL